jgi:WD40 repeat protein
MGTATASPSGAGVSRAVFLAGLCGAIALGCGDPANADVSVQRSELQSAADHGGPPRDDGDGGGAVGVCGRIALDSSFELAPAAHGQEYVRCRTLGPEGDWHVTLSADGRYLAARTGAGTVRLIATHPWQEVAQMASPLGVFDAAAFSPDGTTLALLSAEMGEVTLWRVSDGKRLRSFTAPPASTIDGFASALAYSSDGKRLATSLGAVDFNSQGVTFGAIIDLPSGVVTDWTGAPISTPLVVNPENLFLGVAIPQIVYTAGNAQVFVETLYQIGNSPTSTRLELRNAATGQATVLFSFFSRGLNGFAVSSDRRQIALGLTAEAQVAGFSPGIFIYDAVTAAVLVSDPASTSVVLGFSKDGKRLFTQNGPSVEVLATSDLHVITQFPWSAGATFLAVSPGDDLVAVLNGATTAWLDSSTGATVRTVAYPLTDVSWSRDGRLGAGSGDPAALFHFWRERNGQPLCAPPPRGPAAPPLASLGTVFSPGFGSGGSFATSDDGSIIVTNVAVLHTHSTDWTSLQVSAASDGTLLRVFGATPTTTSIAIAHPSGARLFTPQGAADIAVWCR